MPSSKPVLGVNDLQTKFPEIAAEAYGWVLLEHTKPAQGKKVQETEAAFKRWLKK
jgi:hypothetical protein